MHHIVTSTVAPKKSQKPNETFESLVSQIEKSHEDDIRQLDLLLAPYLNVVSASAPQPQAATQNAFDTNDDLLDFSILDALNDEPTISQFDMTCQSQPYESTQNYSNYTLLTDDQSLVADSSVNYTTSTTSHIEITKIGDEPYSIIDDFRDNHVALIQADEVKKEAEKTNGGEDEENEELLDWERKKTRQRVTNGAVKSAEAKMKPQTPIGKSMLTNRAKQKEGLKERAALLKNALIEESLNRSTTAVASPKAAGSLLPYGYKDLVMNVLRKKKAAWGDLEINWKKHGVL